MMKHNALQLRWAWYEESQNGWHPSATEAVKDFLLWLYGQGGEVINAKGIVFKKRKIERR